MAKKILVVDDDPDAIQVITFRLQTQGYEVIPAQTGEDAIRIAKKDQPDLIIMDIVLPGMNGAEAELELNRDEKTKHIPLIFLTGISDEHGEDLLKELHHPILQKSFDSDQFINTVNELISKS